MTESSLDGRYVLLGDVVGSRDIEDRTGFRTQFEDAWTAVTRTYGNDFAAGPAILKGIDEVGAVLTTISRLYDIVLTVQKALHPHEIRLAVARGEIEFGADPTNVAQMDGEAFHAATALLASNEQSELRFDLDTGSNGLDTAVADEINLLLHRRAAWTDRQRTIVDRYEGTGTQQSIATDLGISQQAVSNVLQAASWPVVDAIESRLRETLQSWDDAEAGDAASEVSG